MSDIHNAAKQLEQAISRVNPSVPDFQELDFHFETPIPNARFGVVDNSVVIRFGPEAKAGYGIPLGAGETTENLEKFLSVAEKIREYTLVSNGVVDRAVLEELKTKINSDFVMIDNGKVSDIKLTRIWMPEDSPKVRIFFDMFIPRTGVNMQVFEDLHTLKPDSQIQLYLKPTDSKN